MDPVILSITEQDAPPNEEAIIDRYFDVFDTEITISPISVSIANFVKFGSIDSDSPIRGHMGHPEASQGDLENQPIL
jgi:hypothetical protein